MALVIEEIDKRSELYRETATNRLRMAQKALRGDFLGKFGELGTFVKLPSLCQCSSPEHNNLLLYNRQQGKFFLSSFRCKSWACPYCAPKNAHKRAKEIEQALSSAFSLRCGVLFATYTLPHSKSTDLQHLINILKQSYTCLVNSRKFKKFREEFGYLGAVKCFDLTYGNANGFHPHFHSLYFFERDTVEIYQKAREILPELWRNMVEKTGYRRKPTTSQGVYIEPVRMNQTGEESNRLAYYMAKNLSAYVSNSGGQSPFLFLDNPTPENLRHYVDFYWAVSGLHVISFTRNLRATFSVSQPEYENACEVVGYFPAETCKIMRESPHLSSFIIDGLQSSQTLTLNQLIDNLSIIYKNDNLKFIRISS